MPVDFLICGTQKGGTSALDAYCREHGEIGMPDEKEQHFFDNDDFFRGGPVDYAVYDRAFPDRDGFHVLGETTPVYMYWPGAAERIHDYNPRMKLITILRDPIERAYSHWQMEFSRGYETLSFGEAIRQEAQRLVKASADERRVWSYVDRGHYMGQLERLWQLFGKSGVLVLRSDDLKMKPAEVLAKVSEFLGISPFGKIEAREINVQQYTSPMLEEDRKFLQEIFQPGISKLEETLGWDLSRWC